jgi:hypothetical protein
MTLVPFNCWASSGVGLAICDREAAAAIHEPVGDRIAGAMLTGVKMANSL